MTNVNLLAKATGLDDLQILGKELTLLQVGGGYNVGWLLRPGSVSGIGHVDGKTTTYAPKPHVEMLALAIVLQRAAVVSLSLFQFASLAVCLPETAKPNIMLCVCSRAAGETKLY